MFVSGAFSAPTCEPPGGTPEDTGTPGLEAGRHESFTQNSARRTEHPPMMRPRDERPAPKPANLALHR